MRESSMSLSSRGPALVGVLCCVCRVYVTLPVLLILAVLATVVAAMNSLLNKTRF